MRQMFLPCSVLHMEFGSACWTVVFQGLKCSWSPFFSVYGKTILFPYIKVPKFSIKLLKFRHCILQLVTNVFWLVDPHLSMQILNFLIEFKRSFWTLPLHISKKHKKTEQGKSMWCPEQRHQCQMKILFISALRHTIAIMCSISVK